LVFRLLLGNLSPEEEEPAEDDSQKRHVQVEIDDPAPDGPRNQNMSVTAAPGSALSTEKPPEPKKSRSGEY
jgi:hypothetical protein